jgi:hypothetical protein
MAFCKVLDHRQHSKPIERKLLCIFLIFFGNAPTTSHQGALPFYKNKNRGNLCQNLKNYILTYQVISNKFTIVRLWTLQRYYKSCGTRHRFPIPIKYPGRFVEWIKKTGNKQLSTLEPMKV